MKQYLLSIVSVALISSVMNLLISQTNPLKKQLSFITSLVMLLVIVSPVIDIINKPLPSLHFSDTHLADDDLTAYENYKKTNICENLQESIRRYIVDTYGVAASVAVTLSQDGNSIDSITVRTHANALEIKKYISQNYNIDTDSVYITD